MLHLPAHPREPAPVGRRSAEGRQPLGEGEAADAKTEATGVLAGVLVAAPDLDARRGAGDAAPAAGAGQRPPGAALVEERRCLAPLPFRVLAARLEASLLVHAQEN